MSFGSMDLVRGEGEELSDGFFARSSNTGAQGCMDLHMHGGVF